MNIHVVGAFPEAGLSELQTDYNFLLNNVSDVTIEAKQEDGSSIGVTFDDGEGVIVYDKVHHFFRGFSLLLKKLQTGKRSFSFEETAQFKTVGPMFDLSRNAVFKTSYKKWTEEDLPFQMRPSTN